MRIIKTFSWKLQPVLGIGGWFDEYRKDMHGFDGWNYNIIIPFIRIQYGEIYL
jgi:hypothetical protein